MTNSQSDQSEYVLEVRVYQHHQMFDHLFLLAIQHFGPGARPPFNWRCRLASDEKENA